MVAPVDQRLPVSDDDVSVIDLPGQNELGPEMAGVAGPAAALTVYGTEVAWQPFASVTLTVYVPAAVTTIACVVAPVDQRFPLGADELSVIDPPGQMEIGPVIDGAGGAGLIVTGISEETTESPQIEESVVTRKKFPVPAKSGALIE